MSFWFRYVFGVALIVSSIISIVLILRNKRIVKLDIMPGDSEESRKVRIIIVSVCFFALGIAIVFDLL